MDEDDWQVNPCPMCGSPAEFDATGTSECYGHAWQTLYIRCTAVNDKHCMMEVSIEADFWDLNENNNQLLVDLWNNLAKGSK